MLSTQPRVPAHTAPPWLVTVQLTSVASPEKFSGWVTTLLTRRSAGAVLITEAALRALLLSSVSRTWLWMSVSTTRKAPATEGASATLCVTL